MNKKIITTTMIIVLLFGMFGCSNENTFQSNLGENSTHIVDSDKVSPTIPRGDLKSEHEIDSEPVPDTDPASSH